VRKSLCLAVTSYGYMKTTIRIQIPIGHGMELEPVPPQQDDLELLQPIVVPVLDMICTTTGGSGRSPTDP
jgi:hypothetical protein